MKHFPSIIRVAVATHLDGCRLLCDTTDLISSGDWLYVGSREGAESWRDRRTMTWKLEFLELLSTMPEPQLAETDGGAQVKVKTVVSGQELELVMPCLFYQRAMNVWKLFLPFPAL